MINQRRTYKSFLLHSPVKITGVDKSGLQFAERGRVEHVSNLGCRFSMRGAVHQGSVLAVEPLGPDGENLLDEFPRLFEISWVKRKGNRSTVAARCLREDELADPGFYMNCSAWRFPAN
jgi:hypothetical protein